MNKCQVDIIVINWNGKHFLNDCLTSILDQSYENTNIVLVDNGSTDGSAAYVAREFRDVKIMELKANHGFAGANNYGISASSGQFVALLNNDAVAHRDWLKESIKCLEGYKDAGFCASKIVDYYRRGVLDIAGDIYTGGGVNAKRGLGQSIDAYNNFEYVFGACAAAVVYRRDMLQEIGLFDEDFFIMCEDIDLSFRAQLAGYKCVYCPKAVVYHKTHGTIKGINKVFSYYGQRNLEYVYFKNMPFRLLLSHLPAHLVYNAAVFCYFMMHGQLLSFLKAKADFILNLPSLLRKRAQIQKNKKITAKDLNSSITGGWFMDKMRSKQ